MYGMDRIYQSFYDFPETTEFATGERDAIDGLAAGGGDRAHRDDDAGRGAGSRRG
jgi:hypothetical protein